MLCWWPVLLSGLESSALCASRQCFLMHFTKHSFTCLRSSLLLRWYLRMSKRLFSRSLSLLVPCQFWSTADCWASLFTRLRSIKLTHWPSVWPSVA
jgi:hypothetical protein